MGWETRRGKRVYIRKQRYRDEQGRSRVRSIYVGPGERGEAAAREDEERRRASPSSRAAPPPEAGPGATGESGHAPTRGEGSSATSFAEWPRCGDDPADTSERAEEFGEPSPEKYDGPLPRWRYLMNLERAAPAAPRRWKTPDPPHPTVLRPWRRRS